MNNSLKRATIQNKIENLSIFKAVITFLIIRKTRTPGLKLIGTIITKFFLPQHQSRLKIRKRKVVRVDHELDNLIPFSTDYLKTYTSFSFLWIKSIYFIYCEFGEKSLSYIANYINSIEQLYQNGFTVSNSCQSTTTRPPAGRNISHKIIHWTDPHLHCIPSLHVMVVCFNYLRIKSIIRKLSGKTDNYSEELSYLENQAVEITNSILYMKQHSINCISAGLFALSAECTEFTNEYALNLINKLKQLNIGTIDRFEEISQYISDLYTNFQELSKSNQHKDILVNFLLKYPELP